MVRSDLLARSMRAGRQSLAEDRGPRLFGYPQLPPCRSSGGRFGIAIRLCVYWIGWIEVDIGHIAKPGHIALKVAMPESRLAELAVISQIAHTAFDLHEITAA